MSDDSDTTADVQNAYQIGDPVMDAAQGRPMIVLDAPDQTVAEWSDANGYDLQENYANGKFDPAPDEAVVECVYVSDVRSEPSKTYTFPVSRVRLIDAHHADDGDRVAERVRLELLGDLMAAATDFSDDGISPEAIMAVARHAGIDDETTDTARELAGAETLEAPDA
jgi:hypothetical protein